MARFSRIRFSMDLKLSYLCNFTDFRDVLMFFIFQLLRNTQLFFTHSRNNTLRRLHLIEDDDSRNVE